MGRGNEEMLWIGDLAESIWANLTLEPHESRELSWLVQQNKIKNSTNK